MTDLRLFADQMHELIRAARVQERIEERIKAGAAQHREAVAQSRGRQTASVLLAAAEIAALTNLQEIE